MLTKRQFVITLKNYDEILVSRNSCHGMRNSVEILYRQNLEIAKLVLREIGIRFSVDKNFEELFQRRKQPTAKQNFAEKFRHLMEFRGIQNSTGKQITQNTPTDIPQITCYIIMFIWISGHWIGFPSNHISYLRPMKFSGISTIFDKKYTKYYGV